MQPQAYNRETDFTERTGDDTDHSAINSELDAAATSINQIRANLSNIQRDDGQLANKIVTADALDDSAFDAVQASVNAATVEAQNSANAATIAATTANNAKDAAIAAKTSAETARDASGLNASNAVASASASAASAAAAAASEAAALVSKNAAQSSQTASATSAATATSKATESTTAAADALVSKNAAQSSQSAAATSAATATTKAGEAGSSAAAASGSANAAAASATLANTAKVDAQTAQTAAELAETNAETAEANAESAQAAATAAKVAAELAETNAETAQAAASSSAATASTQAGIATAQATIATTKAAEAVISASDSAASAVSAASSAASAAALLDNFDDRYLGAKSSAPSVDNDGNALQLGALYFDSTTGKMRVYTASGWLDASSAAVATLSIFEFVATAGQTVFTGADANGATLSYSAPSLTVTLNGLRLRPGEDYSAPDGLNITLTNACSVNDELVIDAFGSFSIASVDGSNIVNGTIPLGKLSATGTPTSSKYLRGDNSWQEISIPIAFPSGTLMLFQQTAAPTGWTKQTTHDNKALRVVSGTAGSGGTTAFTSVFTNQTVSTSISVSGTTGGTTLSTAQMPSHQHPLEGYGQVDTNNGILRLGQQGWDTQTINPTGFTGGNGSHTHSFSGSGSGTSSAVTLNVQYVDLIIASKD